MTQRIRHKKPKRVKKTISMPAEVFEMSALRAAEFPDYSKYVQDLIVRATRGDLKPNGKAVPA